MANTEIKSGADNAQKIRDTRDLKIEQAVELALEDGVFSREELKALQERFHDDRFNIDHNNFREQKNLAESFKSERLLLKAKIDQTNDSDLKGRAQDRFAPNLQASDLSDMRASSDTLPQGFSLHRGAKKDDPKDFNFFWTDEDGKNAKEGTGSNITGMKQEKVFNKGKSSAALDFKYSTLDGILAEWVFGTVFGSESNKSIVLDVTMGSNLAQFLTTLGYKIDRDQRVKVTGEHFRKTADYLFTSGKVTETISQNSLGATYQLKLHDKREVLDYFEASGYITQSQGKELADKDFTIDTATLFELYRNKRNIAGGTKTGASLALGLTPWENGKFKITLGAENLKFKTIHSGDKYDKQGMTAKAEYSHDITKDLMAKISAATSTTEKCVLALELAFKLKPNLQLVLRGEHIERYSSFGLADTSEERGSIALRWTFATPEDQKKIDESARLWNAGAGKRNEYKARETFRQMPQQAKDDFLEWSLSPAYKSTSVIATVDQDTGRLIILDKLLLPNAVIDAQGNITEALPNADVSGIAGVTLNGAPYANNNNFGLSGGNIVIYTGTLREPAVGTTDTYRVTINENGGGTTIATITVQHGSVKVTSITFDRIPAPNQLPPTMGDVPNQSATVGTPITAINLASYTTLTNGDAISSYAIASGALPPGLTFNTTTGVITGTPTVAGTYNITVTATDNDGASNSDAFNLVIAAAPDTTPDAITLVDQNNVALSTVITSAPITVQGISAATAISVAGAGGEYSINGGAWTAAPGTVTNGQTVRVRHTSSGANSTAVNTTLTIGGVSDVFTSTTEALAPANNAPTANNFTYGTNIDNAAKTFDWKVLSAATDVDGNPLTAAVQVQGTKGTFAIAGDNVTYTPAAGQTGSDTGTLRISDGQGGIKDIVVTVNNIDTLAPNTPTGGPTLAAVGGVYYSKLATSNIEINSVSGGRLWINGVDSGVDIWAGGLYNYDANVAEWNNNFSYTIKDIFGNESAPLAFSVFRDMVRPTVDAIPNFWASVASGATVLDKRATFSDNSPFAESSVVNITANNGAIVTLNSATDSYGEKSFDITFPANPGPGPLIVTLTYTVIDAAGNTTLAPVTQTVLVDVMNNAPTGPALADVSRGDQFWGGPIIPIDCSTGVTDADGGDVLTYSATGLPIELSIDPSTGIITGTIDVNLLTVYPVTVTVDDGHGGTLVRSFDLTITDQG